MMIIAIVSGPSAWMTPSISASRRAQNAASSSPSAGPRNGFVLATCVTGIAGGPNCSL